MRIMFPVYKLSSGGAERTVSYLASYLAEKGHEVYILTYIDDDFYSVNPKVNKVSLNQIKFPDGPFNKRNPKYLLKRLVNIYKRKVILSKLTKEIDPDIVFPMLSSMATGFIKMHRKRKFKLISSERANPAFEPLKEVEKRISIFNECDGVIFQTERASNCYSENIQSKSIVIPNAVGNADVYKSISIPSERRKVICAVGRLADQKDYPTLLKAFAALPQEYKEYSLEIYGRGDKLNDLMSFTREIGIDDRVLFMGEDKEALLKCADATCFVMSSVFEGMPNALMEAMALGLPCISTDCPFGPAELIENGVNGLLVPVGDEIALRDAIVKVISNVSFAGSLGNNSKKIIDTNNVYKQCALYEEYLINMLES